jgi:hypothetical protein
MKAVGMKWCWRVFVKYIAGKMSYHQDHMAWQQRVSSEMSAHRR